MASYRGHLMFSTSLGLAYGGAAFWYGGLAWEPAAFGAVLTSLSGLAPDLDSDSGVPVRTLFSVAGLLVPVLLFRRLLAMGLPLPQIAIALGATYLFIRYGLCGFFKRLTVHRGMFHSIPGMFITGLIVFLLYHDVNVLVPYFLASGAMIGFLSHLVLDELCSVNLVGVKVRLNKSAGSALKLSSSSMVATATSYAILVGLLYLAAPQFEAVPFPGQPRTTAENAHPARQPWSDNRLGGRMGQ